MKNLPIGNEDFKEIIKNDSYYVDKTKSIEQLESFGTSNKVILFARPRRFGKTLFLSTLDCFYNIDNKNENKKLFKNLYIEKSSYFKNQGIYPVINISLKDVKGNTFNEMLHELFIEFSPVFDKVDTFKELGQNILNNYHKAKEINIPYFKKMLYFLTEIYYKRYNKKVILLIDEYEAPLLNALQEGYEKEALVFFTSFYSSALKTNPYLEKAVLTGITKITQSSIFSGLNNFIVYDYTKNDFSDTFGFTQDEVNTALKYYNLVPNQQLIKDYYDGYKIGSSEIYNPWSIINYLSSKKLDYYWTNTSNINIIEELLLNADLDIKQDYISLAKGQEINYDDAQFNKLVLEDLKDPERLFDFMIVSGYLNYNQQTKKIQVVNQEVLNFLPDLTKKSLFTNNTAYSKFKKGILTANPKSIELGLNMLLEDIFSYFDFPQNSKETNYHIALASILAISGIGEVKSNLEAGLGRFDIALINNDYDRYSYIIEVKRANTEEEIDILLEEGINQIKEKNYIDYLKNQKNKAIICFCFYKKEVKIKFELI